MHWIRLYHLELEGGEPTNECLLDNQSHHALESTLRGWDWPAVKQGFYSVRVFLMIAKDDAPRSPATVDGLAQVAIDGGPPSAPS